MLLSSRQADSELAGDRTPDTSTDSLLATLKQGTGNGPQAQALYAEGVEAAHEDRVEEVLQARRLAERKCWRRRPSGSDSAC